YHPDKNEDENSTHIYSEIGNAYSILKDVEMRAKYDAFLKDPLADPEYYEAARLLLRRNVSVSLPLVTLITLILISCIQYFNQLRIHQKAIPKYLEDADRRQTALNKLEETGYDLEWLYNRKVQKKLNIQELELEKNLKSTVSIMLDGQYKRPMLEDTVLIALLLIPIRTVQRVISNQPSDSSGNDKSKSD
ncbi:hypothetical protein ROZALSC1DRAFT_30814, partial [Rozella allomycis CSF55]